MSDSFTQSTLPAESVRRRRLWRWFAVGFLVTFVGLLIFYPISFYNGRGVHETVLWRYYVLESGQQMQSSGGLGATSGGWSGLVTVAVEHLAAAVVVGILLALIGRFSRSRQPA